MLVSELNTLLVKPELVLVLFGGQGTLVLTGSPPVSDLCNYSLVAVSGVGGVGGIGGVVGVGGVVRGYCECDKFSMQQSLRL
jgi:hypothetical protein